MIKKNYLVLILLSVISVVNAFAAGFETKGNLLVGGTAAQKSWNKTDQDYVKKYGKFYLLGDIIMSNAYVTAGGKIYYRIGAAEEFEDLTQRLEIKRAFIRFRPFGNEFLEISGGKVYSYYLPGNFFQISEVYTGNSRWGETGVGVKSEINGFTFGLAIPVGDSSSTIETATKYDDFFALNGAVGYDFSKISENFPVKASATAGFTRATKSTSTKTKTAVDEKKGTVTTVTTKVVTDISPEYEKHWAYSLYYTPKLQGVISKLALAVTYSYNAKPFVSNSGYTPVINYNDSQMKRSQFASINFRSNFGPVQLLAEGEAGHSLDGNKIPLYLGTQLLIPIVKHIDFKPRFNAFAAVDSCDYQETRRTYEFYPRLWVTGSSWIVSLGADINHKEVAHNDWKWEWSIPFYFEYKVKTR